MPIQWVYQPTAKEISNSKRTQKLLGWSFHFSGVVYFLVYYFGENKSNIFAIILAILYIIGLLVWHLYLKYTFVLKNKSFDIDDRRIKITEFDKNKIIRYKWEDLKSFSTSIMAYLDKDMPYVEMPDIKPEKFFYVGISKNDFITLRVPEKYITQVQELLKSRLERVN